MPRDVDVVAQLVRARGDSKRSGAQHGEGRQPPRKLEQQLTPQGVGGDDVARRGSGQIAPGLELGAEPRQGQLPDAQTQRPAGGAEIRVTQS